MTRSRTKLLIHVRRIAGLFEDAIERGPDGTLEGHFGSEHPEFIHHSLVFYLGGCMAYLENEDGIKSWEKAGIRHPDFDTFMSPFSNHRSAHIRKISKSSLDALVCIRNACLHNANDLSENHDKNSVAKVQSANLPGVVLTGPIISLEPEFLEFTRVTTLMVRTYHGDC